MKGLPKFGERITKPNPEREEAALQLYSQFLHETEEYKTPAKAPTGNVLSNSVVQVDSIKSPQMLGVRYNGNFYLFVEEAWWLSSRKQLALSQDLDIIPYLDMITLYLYLRKSGFTVRRQCEDLWISRYLSEIEGTPYKLNPQMLENPILDVYKAQKNQKLPEPSFSMKIAKPQDKVNGEED